MSNQYPPAMQQLLDQFANAATLQAKIVQVGSFQPFQLVKVYHDPNDLALTNEHEGNVANNTVVILTDGAARAGLKFKPDTSIIRDRHDETLSLIIASTTDRTVLVEFENYPAKEVTVTANQPVVVNVGLLFGIPMIASTAHFFDVATDVDQGQGNGNGGNSGSSIFDTLINATQVGQSIQYTDGVLPDTTDWAGKSGFLGIKKLTALKDFIFEVPALIGSQELIILANSVGIPTQEPMSAMFNVGVIGQGQLGGGYIIDGDDVAEYAANQGDIIKVRRNGKRLEFTINNSQTYQTAENPNIDSDAWLHVFMCNNSTNVASLTVVADAQS